MGNTEIIIAILGSSFLSSIVASIYSKNSNYNNNKLKYITQERKKWRDFIRESITEFIISDDNKLKHEIFCKLQLNLNPNDIEDKALINCAKEYMSCNDKEGDKQEKKEEELLDRAALLLKHDWDRVKVEANNNSFFPNKAIIFMLFILSVAIQVKFYKYIRESEVLESIKTMIGIDLIFYFFTTVVTMIIIGLIFRMLKLKLSTEYDKDFRNNIYRTLGIPFRKKYE